jgi:Flp pilus assembly protein protease CpaA
MLSILQAMIIFAALLQLALIALHDLKNLRITNRANLSLALTYVVYASIFQSWSDIIAHSVTAGVMLLLLLWPFARNMLGGGDVKFLVIAAFWIGPNGLSLFSIALLMSLLLYLFCARIGWLRMHQDGKLHRVPFGPSGALAMAIVLIAGGVI